LFHFQFHYLH